MERFAIKIDKTLRANLYKICRLCGIDNPDKVKVRDDANIVNLEDGEPELWKKVSDCIGLMITKDDKMPQFMCTLCVDKINDFFEFREMCYATDGQTRKLLGIKPEPKAKVPAKVPSSSIDFKIEDIKEPIPEIIPQRASRKRRNADLDISKEIKTDETEDIKPSTESIGPKKKRIKLSNNETETKLEPGTKPGPSSRATGIAAKKEPGMKLGPASKTAGVVAKKEIVTKLTPKLESASKVGLSKKRLKTEIIVKENKKEVKPAKMTKLMKKKLKEEIPPMVVQEEQQPTKKKKLELLKQKKLPQPVVKSEKLKRGSLDTKIKEEAPVATVVPAPVVSAVPKTKSKLKEKCRICDEGFVNKIHLDKHIKVTHIPTVHRYHCVQCNETLKKNMEIKNHNLWHKLSKTPFKCGNCSELSCSIYTYSKHIRDCNQVAYLDSHIPDWHCPDCSDNYETTYLFNIHSCISKKLVCPGCEKSLKWKEDYFKHIPTCTEAFHRIPPYMTSNIQVKNEADHPSSPIPPISTVPVSTIAAVQTTVSTRVTPPQMDSNQCVVIPGNISLHEEGAGSSSPSKSSRKGKRITKKDLKRFDKLLKSTMTTLVSIKHEPAQGGDTVVQEGAQTKSCEVREPNESPPESPMHCGGDDFHQNDDDTDSADERTPTKPVGTIKQEIIDEGYRDLFNNIEVNIKQEIEGNKSSAEETSPAKKTVESIPPCEESPLTPKPILKLKITKEHGTLNSVLMDSPVSEKKKKKKKRREDRVKSPEKDEHIVVEEAPVTRDYVDVPIPEITSPANDVPVAAEKLQEEPAMPLPEIIGIKKEINETEVDEGREEASSIDTPEADKDTSVLCTETEEDTSIQCTPSIVAASSGSLQILCVSEGVTFHRSDEHEEQMPQEEVEHVSERDKLTPEESSGSVEPCTVAQPILSTELSPDPVSSIEFTSPSNNPPQYMHSPIAEEPYEEIDIKPRLEDLIPMLQIASVTSGADVIDEPIKKTSKKKRRPTVAKHNSIPKIVSVSSENVVSSYKPILDVSPEENQNASEKEADYNENAFDFSQIKIKEEIVDPAYDEESSVTVHQEEDVEHDAEEEEELEEEVAEEEEVEEEEVNEDEVEDDDGEEMETIPEDVQDDKAEEEEHIETSISKRQAEENAYIANIDFNNLTIKQEKEYIDDGLVNPTAFEEEEEEEESSDTDSEKSSSDDDSEESESEREYRDLPSEDEEKDKSDDDEEKTPAAQFTSIGVVHENDAPPAVQSLGLQILTVHSEFSSPQPSEKTESENRDSDENINLNTNTQRPMDQDAINIDVNILATIDQDATNIDEETLRPTEQDAKNKTENTLRPMDQDATNIQDPSNLEKNTLRPIDQSATNITENILCPMDQDAINTDQNTLQPMDQGATNIDEAVCSKVVINDISNNEEIEQSKDDEDNSVIKMEIDNEYESLLEAGVSDEKSTESTKGACITLEETCKKNDFEMDCVEGIEQPSISQIINNVDHPVDRAEELSIQDGENRAESLKSSDDLINISTISCVPNAKSPSDDLKSESIELSQHSQSSSNEEGNVGTCPKEECLKRCDDVASGVDHVVSVSEPDGSCIDQLSLPEVVANAKELSTEQSESATLLITNENDVRNVDTINIIQPSSMDDAVNPSNTINISPSGEYDTVIGDSELNQKMPVSTSERLIETDVSTSAIYCPTQSELPLPTLPYTDDNCQSRIELNLADVQSVHDAEQNSSLIQIPEQNTFSSQEGDTLNRGLSDFIDSQLRRYREETQSKEMPALLDNNLQTIPNNVSANETTDQAPDAFEATNAFMEMGNSPANAIPDGNTSYNNERQEFNVNLQIPNRSLINIPPYSMEMDQYNDAASSYVTFNCNEPCSSNHSRFTEFHDLTPPTAGQLQTSIVDQPVLTELSTNSLTNLPMLSEEVQNLLNEDTAATSNFDFNESILRERSSLDPNPNFNDFENLNEIAENNNNANIERELQDELGNVLAVAIADRSNDDEVDDNNVMNENRANFDIA